MCLTFSGGGFVCLFVCVKLHPCVTPNEDTHAVSQTDGNTDAAQADIWRRV